MKLADLYQQVTNKIVAELKAGAPPWWKPWKNGKATGLVPHNAATGRGYNGINVCLLWVARDEQGWPTSEYMTFKQALAKNACVRKGEKSTQVVLMKRLTVKDKQTEEEKKVGMLRAYSVFNVAQIDGLSKSEVVVSAGFDPIINAEAFFSATGARVRHGGNQPAYYPGVDYISMPEPHQFERRELYYGTLGHETVHWSGAKHRLDRDLSSRFGAHKYAAEELIAELGAAFLCAHLNIQGEQRHSGYIDRWLAIMKEDNRAVFTAAAKAQQAVDYLRGFSEPIEEDIDDAA